MLCRPHNKGPRPLRLSLSAPWASGATGPQPGHWGEQKGGPACPQGRDQTHSGLPWVLLGDWRSGSPSVGGALEETSGTRPSGRGRA